MKHCPDIKSIKCNNENRVSLFSLFMLPRNLEYNLNKDQVMRTWLMKSININIQLLTVMCLGIRHILLSLSISFEKTLDFKAGNSALLISYKGMPKPIYRNERKIQNTFRHAGSLGKDVEVWTNQTAALVWPRVPYSNKRSVLLCFPASA